MQERYIERILKARVYDVAIESPLEAAPRLSRRLGNRILFKREDLQPVFSFKLRGAYNKISHLSDTVARRGVICASAGNHAQGVALAARRRGIPAVIVMPQTTPNIKVQAVLDLGGEVILHGDDFDDAYEHAVEVARERSLTFIHPFDDPDVIAGQGTIGMEILRQHSGTIDAIFVPIGGGGLIAGIAAYVKSLYPQIRIVGVEPEDAASMHDSLLARRRVTLERVGIFADGVAVRRVGEETFRLAQQYVDEVILVSTGRDLRRDPGHLRGQPDDRRAGRRARGRRHQEVLRAGVVQRAHADRAQLRCQHQLRPAAARRRARRHRRRARGAARGRDPGGAGQLPAFLPAARPPQRHRVQLPLRRRERGAHLRRHLAARGAPREGGAARADDGRRLPCVRHER